MNPIEIPTAGKNENKYSLCHFTGIIFYKKEKTQRTGAALC
jgi:hypothetical protein